MIPLDPVATVPSPTVARCKADVRTFFDRLAANPDERHGPAEPLLNHRLQVLDRHGQFSRTDVVLDVGCGDGTHLNALAPQIGKGVGVDLSPKMIEVAREHARTSNVDFRVDDAERLKSIPSSSIDKIICVGVFEHLLNPGRALRQMSRVLKPTGRFVVLTLNGTHWWYRLADRAGVPTRHLTTDSRFTPNQAEEMLETYGLQSNVGYWRFIPSGDLPTAVSLLCRVLDAIGERTDSPMLRGGLRLSGHALPHASSTGRSPTRPGEDPRPCRSSTAAETTTE